jgi:excisionase family DNA binding protein
MIKLICKSYRARVENLTIVLEIDDAQPVNLIPQLMSKADVARYLRISIRKVEDIAQSGRLPIIRVDGAVRFREEDVLRFLNENTGRKLRVLISELPSRKEKPLSVDAL